MLGAEDGAVVAVKGRYLAHVFRQGPAKRVAAYVSAVRTEILPSFANIDGKANAAAEREYERLCMEPVSEDFDGDLSACAEAAQEAGLFYYGTLESLRWTLQALCSVGLFHSLEQELAALCHDASFGISPPTAQLKTIADWYKQHFRIDLEGLPAWRTVDELRLVANTAKHAAGWSAEELRAMRPDLFEDPRVREHLSEFPFMYKTRRILQPLAGEDLFVSEETFAAYGDAVYEFTIQIAEHFELDPEAEYFQ